MSAREDILARVRAGLQRGAVPPAPSIDATLAARREGPRPYVDPSADALLARFVAKSEAYSSTVEVIADRASAPAAVARYLAAMGLPAAGVVQPALDDLDWQGAGLRVDMRGARDADLVGVTGCFCAVAETGTLMLCSSPRTPAAVSLLPETHVALVDMRRIVPHMEDAWNLARSELGSLPRAVNFVSGPSRTGDIEQTIVLGAHGPYRVHLLIYG